MEEHCVPPALRGDDALRAGHADRAEAKVSRARAACNDAALYRVEHRDEARARSAGAVPLSTLAHATPALHGGLPRHGAIVFKDVAGHVRVAFAGANIVAEFLRLLCPDDRINLKESNIVRIPLATQDLPVPRPVLAPAFALGNPLQHGRQRVLLHDDHLGLRHDLGDGTVRVPQRDGLAQEGAEAEQ
jgi:hypothetical protein